MSKERLFWLAWSQIEGVGPVLQKRLASHFKTLAAAWQASPCDLQGVNGIGAKLAGIIGRQRSRVDWDACQERSSDLITPADASYPALLFEIPDPPPVLYYQGNLDLLSVCQLRPGVGVVGTRHPSDYGKRWTGRLTRALCQAGFPIISGLAEGIDRVAHVSCLEAQSSTIAVLGTGVDVFYPVRNQALQQAIAQRGLLLSEYPPGTPPDRAHFPQRNRIIAGLSRAILVTEAPQKSGALITARLANDYGRDVFVLPGTLDNPLCQGCLDLANQGAQLVVGDKELVALLGGIPVEPLPEQTTLATVILPELAPELLAVFQAVPETAQSFDVILNQLGSQAPGHVLSVLTQLEIQGLVHKVPGTQTYQRC